MGKLPIKGPFSNEELESNLRSDSGYTRERKVLPPKYIINPHPGFEKVKLPDGSIAKLAYNKFYPADTDDLDIELINISKLEALIKDPRTRKKSLHRMKFHYRRAISIVSPKFSAGWNRWSENILDLYLSGTRTKVLWGSGNCGKSAIIALLLYVKWRVRPHGRMIIIPAKVVKDAGARVFGYVKQIHAKAPPSASHKFYESTSKDDPAIYCMMQTQSGKWVIDDRHCIISLPIKPNAQTDTIGDNLLGKHPDDLLIIGFDEGQQLPGKLLSNDVFNNWFTNDDVEIFAWGNPQPVDFHAKEEHDLLFLLGAGELSLKSLKEKEQNCEKTGVWKFGKTTVLHITMLDSPKDDPDEVVSMITFSDGTQKQRLHFIAGKNNAATIAENTPKNSPSWYAQVLGFPFIEVDYSKSQGVVTGFIAKEARKYPLRWKTNTHELTYFMGVDPAATGNKDHASIVIMRMGHMLDGRVGLDVMNGEGCRQVDRVEGQDFADTTIETMWDLSQQYGIPLKNISIDTHSAGEVVRYALQRHIEEGKWGADKRAGQTYYIVNPTISPTDRYLFKTLGVLKPSCDIVANVSTEYWIAARCAFMSRQLFNVPEFIMTQFYNRELLKSGNSTKYKLEPKRKMRDRGLQSPNDADALCNAIDLARSRGFSYKFLNTGGYTEYYTPQREAAKREQDAKRRMQIVSNMLRLGGNMGLTRESDSGIDIL